MTLRYVVLMLLIPILLTAQNAQSSRPEEERIRKLVDAFMDAWNRHDAHAFAAVFAEDADFTNVVGVGAHGRSKVEEFHAPRFSTNFKDSHQTARDIKIRFLTPEFASVDVRWEMTGAVGSDGVPIPLRQGLLNWIVIRREGRWFILIMHNQDLSHPK